MSLHDADAELAWHEAAGWVLGSLDPDDADRFAEHLKSCADCRAAVGELGPAAGLLQTAAPAANPPPGLEARTLARVRQASQQRAKARRWRGWSTRMLALAAAVVVAAGVSIGLLLSGPPGGESYSVALHSVSGTAASAQAVVRETSAGWSIQLTAAHLPELPSGQYYECWWTGQGNSSTPIPAGSFTVGGSGAASVQMFSAANPDDFPTMKITTESAAGATEPGQVILMGTATDD